MEQEQSDLNDSYKQSLRNKAERNPTLTKNMPNVKWDQLPPRKGPNSQGVLYGNNKKNSITDSRKVLSNKRND